MKAFAKTLDICGREIGDGQPVYVVAELSANHNQNFEQAVELVEAAAAAGADAVKMQTYTPDTMTLDCDSEIFRVGEGTLWAGRSLYDLYREAQTPWKWQPKLMDRARGLGMAFFSTPFDQSAVAFLEDMGVGAYKVASFELVDLPLIRCVARTGKPMILSTGMATLAEIEEAVAAVRSEGAEQLALLKCTSAYPAEVGAANLRTIPVLGDLFGIPIGVSDHSLGMAVPTVAVSLGASIVEKHLTLTRSIPGPDAPFSLEPSEFREMVEAVRSVSGALGDVRFGPTESEEPSGRFRRSLFVVENIKLGESLTPANIRSIRPGLGLPPKYLDVVMGGRATRKLSRGTPLRWGDFIPAKAGPTP